MKVLKTYQILLIVILLTLMMFAATTLLVSRKMYTSKVTWIEEKGFPLISHKYKGYFGHCGPGVDGVCKNLSKQDVNYFNGLANFVFYGIISSLVMVIYYRRSMNVDNSDLDNLG